MSESHASADADLSCHVRSNQQRATYSCIALPACIISIKMHMVHPKIVGLVVVVDAQLPHNVHFSPSALDSVSGCSHEVLYDERRTRTGYYLLWSLV